MRSFACIASEPPKSPDATRRLKLISYSGLIMLGLLPSELISHLTLWLSTTDCLSLRGVNKKRASSLLQDIMMAYPTHHIFGNMIELYIYQRKTVPNLADMMLLKVQKTTLSSEKRKLLWIAVRCGCIRAVEHLTSTLTFDRETIRKELGRAILCAHFDIASHLTSLHDEAVDSINLNCAVKVGDIRFIELLMENQHKNKLKIDEALLDSSWYGHNHLIKYFISKGVSTRTQKGLALHYATVRNHYHTILYLILVHNAEIRTQTIMDCLRRRHMMSFMTLLFAVLLGYTRYLFMRLYNRLYSS
jgi:hypothetical protein